MLFLFCFVFYLFVNVIKDSLDGGINLIWDLLKEGKAIVREKGKKKRGERENRNLNGIKNLVRRSHLRDSVDSKRAGCSLKLA